MKPAADVLEDLEWLDETSVGAFEAAERSGFPSAVALEKWLERHDRYDLWLRFRRRDPEGAHHQERKRMDAVPTTDSLSTVLADAAKSGKAATRRKAERVRTMIDELRDAVTAEVAEQREKDKARAEVTRLERQLAAAKARLRGKPHAEDEGPTAAEVRAWATANGIDCPDRGRIPSEVREQYDAAHAEDAA